MVPIGIIIVKNRYYAMIFLKANTVSHFLAMCKNRGRSIARINEDYAKTRKDKCLVRGKKRINVELQLIQIENNSLSRGVNPKRITDWLCK